MFIVKFNALQKYLTPRTYSCTKEATHEISNNEPLFYAFFRKFNLLSYVKLIYAVLKYTVSWILLVREY